MELFQKYASIAMRTIHHKEYSGMQKRGRAMTTRIFSVKGTQNPDEDDFFRQPQKGEEILVSFLGTKYSQEELIGRLQIWFPSAEITAL